MPLRLRDDAAPLMFILLFAGLVRAWGIGFGLPNPLCRPDEILHAQIAVSIANGNLDPGFFKYPSLYFYLMGLVYATVMPALGLAAAAAPHFNGYHDFVVLHPQLLLVGRIFSAVAGTLLVGAVYLLGRRLDERAGLAAALLMAFNYLGARDAHFMSVDTTMALLVTLCLGQTLAALETGSRRSFIWAGVLAGLATSVKYNAAFLAVSILLAHVIRARQEGTSIILMLRHRRLWRAATAMVGAFLLTSPFIVLNHQAFLRQFQQEAIHFSFGEAAGGGSALAFYLGVVARHGLGWAPAALALIGLGGWLYRRQPGGLVVLAFGLCYGAAMVSGETAFARYLVPLMPVFCVAAGQSLTRLWDRLPRGRAGTIAATGLVLVVLSQPLWNIGHFDWLLTRRDTRLDAGDWIRRLPPGRLLQVGGVGVHHYVLHGSMLPGFEVLNQSPLSDSRAGGYVDFLRGRRIDYVLTHEYPLRYSVVEPELRSEIQRDLVRLECFSPGSTNSLPAAVFDREDAFYLPFARFDGYLRPGPRICLYRVP